MLIKADTSAASGMTGHQRKKIPPKWEAGGDLPPQLAASDEQPEISNQEHLLSSRVPLISISFTQKFMNHLPSQVSINLIHSYLSV